MELIKQFKLAMNDEFITRVQQAMVTAAIAIAAEKDPSPRRASYATQILNDPQSHRMRFAFGVAANPAIDDMCTDDEIQFTVNSIFNAYAGAYKTATEEAATSVLPFGEPKPSLVQRIQNTFRK